MVMAYGKQLPKIKSGDESNNPVICQKVNVSQTIQRGVQYASKICKFGGKAAKQPCYK